MLDTATEMCYNGGRGARSYLARKMLVPRILLHSCLAQSTQRKERRKGSIRKARKLTSAHNKGSNTFQAPEKSGY